MQRAGYSRLIHEFVGEEGGSPQLHLLTKGQAKLHDHSLDAASSGTAASANNNCGMQVHQPDDGKHDGTTTYNTVLSAPNG
jgi:hypothetical protein